MMVTALGMGERGEEGGKGRGGGGREEGPGKRGWGWGWKDTVGMSERGYDDRWEL